MTTLQQPQHPVLGAVVAITASLDEVAEANPSFMATDQKAATLVEIARAKAQLAELELRVLAAADDVAADSPRLGMWRRGCITTPTSAPRPCAPTSGWLRRWTGPMTWSRPRCAPVPATRPRPR